MLCVLLIILFYGDLFLSEAFQPLSSWRVSHFNSVELLTKNCLRNEGLFSVARIMPFYGEGLMSQSPLVHM